MSESPRRPLHSWRIYGDSEDFEASLAISSLTKTTETEPIDQMFEDGMSIWSGRGTPPHSPHLQRQRCPYCKARGNEIGCWWCCEAGTVLRWIPHPPSLMQEIVKGIRAMIREFKEL